MDNMRTLILGESEGIGAEGTITFQASGPTGATIVLHPNGDIYVNGRLAENDVEVVNAMRRFLLSAMAH
jgi:hypothetical protein